MNAPIIHLEIQGMKQTILTALRRNAADIDSYLQGALDKLCTEENLRLIVEDEARKCINAALREEVGQFFRYSAAGRQAVRDAVHERLEQQFPTKDPEA